MRLHRISGKLYTMVGYPDGTEVIVHLANEIEARAMRDALQPGGEIETVEVSAEDAALPLVVRRLAAAVTLDTVVPTSPDFLRWLRERGPPPRS